MYDYTIIGAGIVGLSVGMELTRHYPNARVLIVEKESAISAHQTGRNSGVIHSGIYYKPGSLKAKLARTGNQQIVDFCKKHNIEHDICGKVIVATNQKELPLLENLYERGLQNHLDVEKISPKELKEIEPHVNGIAAIRIPSTGIVNYQQVAKVFAEQIQQNGGQIMLDTEVRDMTDGVDGVELHTNQGIFQSRSLINCGGLFSDRIAQMAGIKTDMRIIPFRGEYFELKPEKHHLVQNLIYPVPNPDFPFLGIHFTRMLDGRVLIGPNAVLSFKREGYSKKDFEMKDFIESATYPGLLKLAGKNATEGLKEMYRSYSKKALVKEVQRFIPEIGEDDIVPGRAGVRAQALDSDGHLIDDFMMIQDKRMIHVCNAPSPAATASIEIGREIVSRVGKNEQGTVSY
ncbi:L-2-hydroxyglutarate oxidase [Halobacillus naozhouensis]|uniref:L-2-hydroxyglutarate oxidase n=1 Tax=Halobacillus naozhouensis TaxID=554880 RepID=A0ABY8J661_9BACI|nr:L-2-hydroxyglutarate oxidase [Halobacillus naozhouensis]WFT76898.1 L-2-hydroxyglutarate oxidase [Halobacillus naozhouensis]